MYDDKLEALISVALADGTLSEKERQVLFKTAREQGIDLEEFEMVLQARILERQIASDGAKRGVSKSDKYGSVRKCPACGAIVATFNGVCNQCGLVFTEVDANRSSQQLYEALSRESSVEKKQEIIETFPIPNTKADLLEFLTALKPRLMDVSSDFANSYSKKYAECIEKIKVAFVGDKHLQPFVDEFAKLKKELRRKRIWTSIKRHPIWTIFGVLMFISILSSIFGEPASEVENANTTEFVMHIEAGDAASANAVLQKMGVDNYDLAIDLIELYVENGDVGSAVDVYEKLTPGHCSMGDMRWSMYRHGANAKYEPTATKLIRRGAIEAGKYDVAWEYSQKESDNENYYTNAKDYYQFMSDVVLYLCQENRAADARKFINTYSLWFTNNIDPLKGGDYDSQQSVYNIYNSKNAKAQLLQIINEFK